MNVVEETAATKKLFERLDVWDHGTSSDRIHVLVEFVNEFGDGLCTDLETQLALGGSLLLARFQIRLQMTYLRQRRVRLILKAISIFITAPEGSRYASEMIERGLLITLLDILMKNKFKEDIKMVSIDLLVKIAFRGRRYKESICESHGVRVLCEFIASSGINHKEQELICENCDLETSIPCQKSEGKGTIQQWHKNIRPYEQIQCDFQPETEMKVEEEEVEEVKKDEEPMYLDSISDEQWNVLLDKYGNNKEDDLLLELIEKKPLVDCRKVLQKARELLSILASGNPLYQKQIAKVLLMLISSVNYWAQVVACQVLKKILPQEMELCKDVIQPLMAVLGTPKKELLYEVLQLMDIVMISPYKEEMVVNIVDFLVECQFCAIPKNEPLFITEPDLNKLDENKGGIAQNNIRTDAILVAGYLLNRNSLKEFLDLGLDVILTALLSMPAYPQSQIQSAKVLRKLILLSPTTQRRLINNIPQRLLVGIMVNPAEAARTISIGESKHLCAWIRHELEEEDTLLKSKEKSQRCFY